MSDELNLEQAVEILNRERFMERDDWFIQNRQACIVFSRNQQLGVMVLNGSDVVIAIAKSLVAEERIEELERVNAMKAKEAAHWYLSNGFVPVEQVRALEGQLAQVIEERNAEFARVQLLGDALNEQCMGNDELKRVVEPFVKVARNVLFANPPDHWITKMEPLTVGDWRALAAAFPEESKCE